MSFVLEYLSRARSTQEQGGYIPYWHSMLISGGFLSRCLGQEVGRGTEVWFLRLVGLGNWRNGAERRGRGSGANRLTDRQIGADWDRQ